ncbi:hypothetical protein Goarm_005068, partial [Gossypium armourianum]|nr:hypothetical protein [Gossypium armourianum]
SIATTSLLGHRPLCGRFSARDVSCKQKSLSNFLSPFKEFIGKTIVVPPSPRLRVERLVNSSIKALAMELTKEVYAYEGKAPRNWSALFEWEGVIIEDNPQLEKQAWLALAEEEGKSPPPAFILRRIEGMKNEQAISEVLCWSRDPAQLRRMAARREEVYQALQGGIYRLRNGSQEFLNALTRYKIPMALVSTRPRKVLETAIRAIGMEGFFSVIVAAEDVYRGKPDPEMFVYGAQLLKFIPERCIVFGNSNQTVEAAHDAWMKCVTIASKHPVYELGAADLVVNHLDELSIVDLKNLADIESAEFGSREPESELEIEEEESRPSTSIAIDDIFW